MRSRLMSHEANMIRKARAHRSRDWRHPEVESPNLQADPLLEYYRVDDPTGPWGRKLTSEQAHRMLDLYVEAIAEVTGPHRSAEGRPRVI